MAAIAIPTLKEIALQDITSVKLVFYPKDITSDNWDDVAEALGDQLDNDGPNVVTMQFDPETSTEDLLQFLYNSKESLYRSNKNHILFFSGNELAAIENLGQDEILLSSINLLKLSVSLQNIPINSDTVQSNFLINTESIPNVPLDYNEHTDAARKQGLGKFPVAEAAAIHPNIYGVKSEKDGIDTEPVLLRTEAADYLTKQSAQSNIIVQVEDFDDSHLHQLQIKPGSFLFEVNNDSRKYLYSLFYYYNRGLIQEHIKNCLTLLGIFSDDSDSDSSNEESYTLPDDVHLGFNDRTGSYLYLYDLNVLNSGYMLVVMIGSNSNNQIDIYLAKNIAPLSRYTPDSFPLQINHWYDRLYFTLPMYDSTGLEQNSLRPMYSIFPDTLTSNVRPKPVTRAAIFTIPDPRHEGAILSTDLQVNYYLPSKTIYDTDIPECVENSMDTRMLRLMEDYDHIYMPAFCDIGDVLINAEYTDSGIKVSYFNIFGDTAGNGNEFSRELFNTYDFEGRVADAVTGAAIEDRGSLDLLPGYFITSGQQLKYLLEHNYKPVYLNSAYSVGYDAYSDKYLILFKCDNPARVRRSIEAPFRFMDDYILHPDYVEFLNGDQFSITDTVSGLEIRKETTESFCGITDPGSILAADRRTIILPVKNNAGDIIGAYRY